MQDMAAVYPRAHATANNGSPSRIARRANDEPTLVACDAAKVTPSLGG
jgi:hypothetical protein